ncbi:protein grindelwald [Orussus abietinus]|uniref:protein grindelwald n=1 Tax=Orussus abietinus TaxID=222816 RepID=UPI000626A696|nr:protein grindelwald [Orussus abietinus]
MSLVTILGIALVISVTRAALSPDGIKCGQQRCSTTEYCSPFDQQCRPCSVVCDPSNHNQQMDLCVKDCQEYLHDQRYVLRQDFEQSKDLKAELDKLKTQLKISLTLTCLALVAILYLLTRKFTRTKLRKFLQKDCFRKKWIKKATNKNKVQNDAEVGVPPKQNGLKLTMPTISGSIVGPQSTNGDATPNTTSTPLSGRHPSEDTTLDYAYDNPAMTPSPETAQTRTKRESSF